MINLGEFIDSTGGLIKGNRPNMSNKIQAKNTTDDTVKSARQWIPSRYTVYRRYQQEDDMSKHPLYSVYEKSKTPKEFISAAKKKTKDMELILDAVKMFYGVKEKGKVKESKHIVDRVIEDLYGQKGDDHEFVSKNRSNMVKSTIPEIESIEEEQPLVAKKAKRLVGLMHKNEMSPEEKSVILSYILDGIDASDIPSQYRDELKRKI